MESRRDVLKYMGLAGASAMVGQHRTRASEPAGLRFGYILGNESEEILESGVSPEAVLTSLKASAKDFNPYARPWTTIEHQENQGSCAGHALAHAFHVCMVQKYGIQVRFSRGGAYYMAQAASGIEGDRGSTLSGCQAVANAGLCLESEWPYPEKYDNTRPEGIFDLMDFTLAGSSRVKDADLAWEILRNGGCIQTGVDWGDCFEKRVSDKYGGFMMGGHSTLLFGLDPKTDNAIHHNSWGNGWMNNGRSQWTKNFFSQILKKDRWCVFVAYDPADLAVPANFVDRCLKG